MGSDKKKDSSAIDDEIWPGEGQGSVILADFYIGKLPLTLAQFKACVTAEGCAPRNVTVLGDEPDHPVVNVTWHEALQYCDWLVQVVRDSPKAPAELRKMLAIGWRVGLPSEAEWEKAARGTDGRT